MRTTVTGTQTDTHTHTRTHTHTQTDMPIVIGEILQIFLKIGYVPFDSKSIFDYFSQNFSNMATYNYVTHAHMYTHMHTLALMHGDGDDTKL